MMPGGMNPKQMQKMMQQLGIKSIELKAQRVIIEQEGKRTIIDDPQITVIEMRGQKNYQISGNEREEEALSADDVKMVVEQARCSEAEARAALKEAGGDIAEAILKLKG